MGTCETQCSSYGPVSQLKLNINIYHFQLTYIHTYMFVYIMCQGWRSQYSDLLQAGQYGDQIPVGA